MPTVANYPKAKVSTRSPSRRGTEVVAETSKPSLPRNEGSAPRFIKINSIDKIVESFRERQSQEAWKREKIFHDECASLVQVIEQWKEKNKSMLDLEKTKILTDTLVSSSGRVCFQLFVSPKKEQFQAKLEEQMTLLDRTVCEGSSFTIIQLVSFFI